MGPEAAPFTPASTIAETGPAKGPQNQPQTLLGP